MTEYGGVAWECQRAVDAEVPVSFAWQFMTNVDNWSDPPAEFTLEGPFVAGARGTTSLPGQPAISWIISHVDVGRSYTIEGSELFERACLRIHWRFEAVTELGTRLTQHLELVGDNAAAYVEGVSAAFEANLEPGMKRIAQSMADAYGRT